MLLYTLVAAVLLGGTIRGCSDNKEPASEKGAIKQMTEEAAREAVKQIRTPVDKARSAAKQQEDQNRELEDALKKQ